MNVPALPLRPAWALLKKHHQKIKRAHLRQLFAGDRKRGDRLAIEAAVTESQLKHDSATNALIHRKLKAST